MDYCYGHSVIGALTDTGAPVIISLRSNPTLAVTTCELHVHVYVRETIVNLMYLYQTTYDRNVCRFIFWFSCLSVFYRFYTTVLVQTQYRPTEIQTKIKAWEPNRVSALSLSKDLRKPLRFLNKHESYVLKKHWAILSIGFFPRILPRIRLSQTIFFVWKPDKNKRVTY